MIKKINRALVSAFNKEGIVDFVKFLADQGTEIVSTGGTAKLLRENNIEVKDISDLTGFPEMLDGRVKTLHPRVHGGLLYVRGNQEHENTIKEHDIKPIDLVLIDLYPFDKVAEEEKIEMIDIGGPSMLRSSAKNFDSVTVIANKNYMQEVQAEIEKEGGTTLETRKKLAGIAFKTTSQYDSKIAEYFDPNFKGIFNEKIQELRYGENPHQTAGFYKNLGVNVSPSIVNARQLHGKELSFNNILDGNAALELATEFSDPFCAVIKHTNPCGAAEADTIEEAFEKAHAGDPLSAFGGIIAINRPCSKELAEKISQAGFFEIIIAPSFASEALEILQKKKNVRLLEVGEIKPVQDQKDIRSVLGGFLIQDRDEKMLIEKDLQGAEVEDVKDLLFSWKIVKYVKSNAIAVTKNRAILGIGAGQMSRVKSMDIALEKAGEKAKGAICSSDAFFPFADSVELASKHGIKTIVQPGGSVRDPEVLESAKKLNIKMVLTGTRAFKH